MEYCSGLWEAPPFVEKITSPLSEKRQKWATLMYQHHPDKELTSFLLRGLETGFRIGYAWKTVILPEKWNKGVPQCRAQRNFCVNYIHDGRG